MTPRTAKRNKKPQVRMPGNCGHQPANLYETTGDGFLAIENSEERDVGSLADRLQAATNPECGQFYYLANRDTSNCDVDRTDFSRAERRLPANPIEVADSGL
jgi:hypothetical protein